MTDVQFEGTAGRPVLPMKSIAAMTALFAVPVALYLSLDLSVASICHRSTEAGGMLPGKILWRADVVDCGLGKPRHHDLQFGAVGKPLSTAVTSTGAVPLDVERLSETEIAIVFDRAVTPAGDHRVVVAVRRSGSPAQRIDLDAR